MATRTRSQLRLRRDDGDASQGSFPFPSNAAARRRLVAGTVDLPATPDENTPSTYPYVVGRIGPDDFLRGIESTLERMQSRLDNLRREADDAFKFPTPDTDGPRPRAA